MLGWQVLINGKGRHGGGERDRCGRGWSEGGLRDGKNSSVPEIFLENAMGDELLILAMYWCAEPLVKRYFTQESSNTCWGDNSSTKVCKRPRGFKGIRCVREVMEGRGDLLVKDWVLESLRVEKGFVKVREVSSQKEHLVKEVFLLFFLVYKLKLSTVLSDDFVVIIAVSTELPSTEWDGESIMELFW